METVQIQTLNGSLRKLIGYLEKSSYYFKKQQIYRGVMVGKELWQEIPEVLELLAAHIEEINGEEPVIDMNGVLLCLQSIQEAQEKGDYVLLSDLYELQLMPALVSVQERIAAALGVIVDEKNLQKNVKYCAQRNSQLLYSIMPDSVIKECLEGDTLSDSGMDTVVSLVEKCMASGCTVEPTSSGYLTMTIQEKGHPFYLHTNGRIVTEAVLQAEEWLSQEKMSYTFYGLGMGYPYIEMLTMDDNIAVKVIEMNRELLILAFVFAPLWMLFQDERFELVYDPTGHRLERMQLGLDEDNGFFIFYPALHGIKKMQYRERLEIYFMEESSVRIHSRNMLGNFKKNIAVTSGNIQDLREKIQNRDVIIAAAGPSLDRNMMTLKERGEETVLLAVGTVLQKLLRAGIRPDYVIMIDSGQPVYRQIQGLEDCNIPLIFLSTVYSKIPKEYQGEKYILCQQGFAPAERLAEHYGWQTVESGGSVATTALDLCLRLSARRIIFVGLDLAFTGGVDHAEDTAYQTEVAKDTGIMVQGVNGKEIMTGQNLKIYLDWIEHRLEMRTEEERNVDIIDATEGGAFKAGMKHTTLKAALTETEE